MRYIARLIELGCSISLASDSHDIGPLETILAGEKALDELGIPEEQIWHPRAEAKIAGSRHGAE